MAWADARVWGAVLGTLAADGDASLREKLWHIHMVQRAFFAIWLDSAAEVSELSIFPGLRSLEEWGRAYHDEVTPFLETLAEPSLDRVVHLPWAARFTAIMGVQPANPTMRETLLQVAMHSLYHRGQVNMRLRELGTEPPLVDYIAWIWIGRPTPDWP